MAAGTAPRWAFVVGSALLAGCATAPTDTGLPSGAPPSDGARPEVHRALEATLPRSATFAGVEFTVLAAEITNIPPLSLTGQPTPGPNLIARVELSARNLGPDDSGYAFNNEAFWLRTYSGQRITASDETGLHVDLRLAAGESRDAELYYFVPREDSLLGAALLIGHPPDAQAFLPLTGNQVAPAYPMELEASGSDAARAGPIEWRVESAMLGLDLPPGVCCPETGQRADETERFLTLALRGTVDGSQYGQASITSGEVELLVDGASVGQPFGFAGRANVPEGKSFEFDATWLIGADAERLVVRFSSPSGETGSVELEIPEA